MEKHIKIGKFIRSNSLQALLKGTCVYMYMYEKWSKLSWIDSLSLSLSVSVSLSPLSLHPSLSSSFGGLWERTPVRQPLEVGPALYKGNFNIDSKPKDTFIDMKVLYTHTQI